MPRAASLAAKLKAELGLETELIEGERGVFDVVADGELIFSKHRQGRFPDEGEVVERIRNRER